MNGRYYEATLCGVWLALATLTLASADLVLTGVIDGPLAGGLPKAVELYAVADVSDLSLYAIGSANNGGGTSGPEFTFPAGLAATAGDFLYVATEETQFEAFFGFTPDFTSSAVNINGDDAMELYREAIVVDKYGDVDIDGTGQVWEYLDGWAYRNGAQPTGIFDIDDWTTSGTNALDGALTNAAALVPFPVRSFQAGMGPAPVPSGTPVPTISPTLPEINPVKIHEIQGNGFESPLVGSTVEVEAIVVGDFQDDGDDTRNLGGFFLQEESTDGDGDDSTSDGIFVSEPSFLGTNVELFDKVRVIGTVAEFFGMTQLTAISIEVVSSSNELAVMVPDIFLNTEVGLEQYEGMLVRFPEELLITEMFNFDRFGEIQLAEGARPFQFTQLSTPDVDGYDQFLTGLAKRTIVLDDGKTIQNPDPLDLFGFEFSTSNFHRMGDSIAGLTGVLSFQFGIFRVHSVNADNTFVRVNKRPDLPSAGDGSLRVASFNVLNYFVTIDENGNTCGPSQIGCRGADNVLEFARQREKTVTALAEIGADIFGLIEVENDINNAAVNDLAEGLNEATQGKTYAALVTGSIGGDAIKAGLIYDASKVSPRGGFQILDSGVDPRFIDNENRPVLVQTFTELSSGGVLTVAVCHFKSKGSPCDDIGDPDRNDGAGNCDITRTTGALALADFLAQDPTDSGSDNFLILGDLNSYAKEAPIVALEEAGFTNLELKFEGPSAYGYVFGGQLGTLDYALSSPSLTPKVTGAATWHINADEADALDYNTDFGRNPSWFDGAVPYRASDHDPVVVGINLAPATEPSPPPVPTRPPTSIPTCGSLASCFLENLDNGEMTELVNGLRYEPAGDTYSIRCMIDGAIDQVTFYYNNETHRESRAPWYLNGDSGQNVNPEEYLEGCGMKAVGVTGNVWRGECFKQMYAFEAYGC